MTEDGTPARSGPRPATRLWRAGLTLALASAVAFAIVSPPERCPAVTAPELRDSAQATVDWFVRNQDPDGTWLYLYYPEDDLVAPEYNAVRHAGVTMGLYQAAAAELPGALRSADRGTGWALDRLLERDGWAAIDFAGEVSTGASSLLIAGLAIRREATGDARYDDVLRRLGRFVLAQTESSGAVLAQYDTTTGAPVPGEYSLYYTGEAYWALALLHRVFPDEGWGEAADRIGAYLATSRDEIEGHWPALPDHWAAYGQSETVEFPERASTPLTEPEVDYARRQAELFGSATRWVSQQLGPWGTVVRGGDTPRGGGYGVINEALTGWWLVAQQEPRLAGISEPVGERAACIAGLAVDEQWDAEDAADAASPERVEGAWVVDGETRMDDQQHALAGLLRTIPIVEARAAAAQGDSSDPSGDAPAGWLWAIALILALNPARAAFGIPRRGRPSPDAASLAAFGGAIGGVGVCIVAGLADPLLDALDVSDPSFRVAAGIVAVFAGAADLFRRPPPAEPSLPGWRAALVPVAIPVVGRPALVVLALGAGADQDLLVTAGAMAAGVAILVALTARAPTEGASGRVLRWGGRLLAAGLVACGVVLTVDGVLDV
jgi:small neutral amino acid transporter SnatA (MarC family)